MRTRWMDGTAPHKSGRCQDRFDNNTQSSLDLRYLTHTIHVTMQISIRYNSIEYWAHLRCAGIRRAQYTNTWTCHIHKESRLTTHGYITTPTLPSHPATLPTPPQSKHRHTSHTHPVPTGTAFPSPSHARTLSVYTHHMQHQQQYTHHSHIIHRIHIGYQDNLTDRPKFTTGLQTPHKYTDPAVKVGKISYCRSTYTESKTNLMSSNCLFTTHIQLSAQLRKPSSPLKQNLPNYITSPQCAPIGCTRQGVGLLHSLENLHSLQQTYLRPLLHTAHTFK